MPNILLRPALLGIKNKLKKDYSNIKECSKILFVIFCSLATVIFFYELSFQFITLSSIKESGNINPFENIIPNIFLSLFLLIFFSAIICCIGSLFLSTDLNFLLSKPISLKRIYLSKLLKISFQTSWMVLIAILAFLVALQQFYALSFWFLLTSVSLLLPFIILSTACSTIFSTILVYIFPAHRIKEILALIFVGMALLLFGLTRNIAVDSGKKEINEITKETFHRFLSKKPKFFSKSKLMPHLLYSNYLNSNFSTKSTYKPTSSAITLVALASFFTLAGSLLYEKFLFTILSSSQNRNLTQGSNKNRLMKLLQFCFPKYPQFKSLLYKEVRLLLRDTTQSLQLLMLLILTLAYLYNFRLLRNIAHLDLNTEEWWRAVLGSANTMLGGFIVAAIATRFTYPTISFEGKSWELIRNAPISISNYLKNKFLIWLIPLAIINFSVVISGAVAMQLKPISILITFVCSSALTISITALAIGAGASYAKFDWDNSSQIATGMGSLAYMTLGFIIITLNQALLMPVMSIIEVTEVQQKIGTNISLLSSVAAIFIIILLNFLIAKLSLKYGEKFLESREL